MTSPLRQMTEAARRMAAGDYARARAERLHRRGRRARPGLQHDVGRPRHRRPPAARPGRERLPRAAYAARRAGRRAREPRRRRDRARPGDDARRSRPGRAAQRPRRRPARPVPRRRRRGRARPRADQPVAPVVEAAVAEARSGPGASQRGVTFDVRVEPPDLSAYADRARLHQLLANLLDNAARHSPAGGVVHVSAGVVGGTPPARGRRPGTRHRAAGPRAGLRTVRHPAGLRGGGTGLGLAIARWVTDLHGGRITVVDPVPGETGARFRVELPRSPDRPAPERNLPMDAPPHAAAPTAAPVVPPADPADGRVRLAGGRRLRHPLGRRQGAAAPLGAAGLRRHRRLRRARRCRSRTSGSPPR